jgi:D-glycero-alpha-D-manno-heptose-7-phosphate kinase
MSFVGGGSDLPEFYREHGGAVLSTSIDRYVYVTVNKKFDDGIRVAYSRTEEVSAVRELEHPLVRAVLRHVGLTGGVEITTIADIPSRGTGLGSSSSFTIALLHALNAYCGRHSSKSRLAEDSSMIEIDICQQPIGKQDQYAAAFGGLNLFEFQPDDSVRISPIICDREKLQTIRSNLLLLYTGITRSASEILHHQIQSLRASADKRKALRRMVQLCYTLRDEIQANNIDAFGDMLHENWELKKSLSNGISTPDIDEWYATAKRHGAKGGKLLGAGAGGFLLLYADREKHNAICHALPHLRPIDIDFDRHGSQIIFYQPSEEQRPFRVFRPAPLREFEVRSRSVGAGA